MLTELGECIIAKALVEADYYPMVGMATGIGCRAAKAISVAMGVFQDRSFERIHAR
jgi:hypothetical protein